MLKHTLALVILLLAAAGCEQPRDPLSAPLTVEATYRLLYNDSLVGTSLFVLDIDNTGHYRLEAFTTPAGKMQRDEQHEVLETSTGAIDADAIRPASFEESVLRDGELAVARLSFDWPQHTLLVQGASGERKVGLLPDTHDRLSYLIAASRLAAAGSGSRLLQVASADASEENRLDVGGHDAITLPLGHYEAVRIERTTPDPRQTRSLWYAPGMSPLPLRALQVSDGNSVEMQLEDVSLRPSGLR